MPRRGAVKKRVLMPDPVYNSLLVTRLINRVMKSGKKTIARKQVYKALELVEKKTKLKSMVVFNQVIDNLRPSVEVRSRRVGGAAYQVPMPVKGLRQNSLAIRWLILSARTRSNKEYHSFAEKLAAEIIDAFNQSGGALDKKQGVEKVAEANRAFAHLRW